MKQRYVVDSGKPVSPMGKERNGEAEQLSQVYIGSTNWLELLFRSKSVCFWGRVATWVAPSEPLLLVFSLLCSFLPHRLSLVLKLALV